MALVALLASPAAPHAVAVDIDSLMAGVNALVSPPSRPVKTETGGILVTQATCVSKEPIDSLALYFTKKFQEAGFLFPPALRKMKVASGKIVSAFDTENLVTHTVFLQPNGNLTTIVVTEGDMGHLNRSRVSEAIAAVYPGANDVVSAKLEGSQLMTYSIAATPAEIKNFYRETLTKEGYREVQGESDAYANASQHIKILVRPGITVRYVTVHVSPAYP